MKSPDVAIEMAAGNDLPSSDLYRQQLVLLIDHLNPEDKEATLSTLRQIFSNISRYPDVDKYRQIKVANKKFNNTVWRYPAGKELMRMSGWVVDGEHVTLKDDSYIRTVTGLLTSYTLDKPQLKSEIELLPKATATLTITCNNDEMCELPVEYRSEMVDAIQCGNSLKLRSLLEQIKIPANKILLVRLPLVHAVLTLRQIGIARILIKEYSVEINSYHIRAFFDQGAPESEVIDLISEFNVDIKSTKAYAFIPIALLCKCFEIVKFAIEKCGYDVNSIIRDPNNDKVHGTLLHYAYYINEPAFAEYLISKGADKNATDTLGLKPIEYSGGVEAMVKRSECLVQRRLMTQNFNSEENKHFMKLLIKGYSNEEAVSHVLEKFALLKPETEFETPKRNLSDFPTIKELNRYITEMAPSYFDTGLELDVLNSQLKLIKNDPSLPDLKEKCRKMLEVWLENDTSATWKKLCDALCEIGQKVLAEQIKSA